jgi:hypothetical protein
MIITSFLIRYVLPVGMQGIFDTAQAFCGRSNARCMRTLMVRRDKNKKHSNIQTTTRVSVVVHAHIQKSASNGTPLKRTSKSKTRRE